MGPATAVLTETTRQVQFAKGLKRMMALNNEWVHHVLLPEYLHEQCQVKSATQGKADGGRHDGQEHYHDGANEGTNSV